MRIWNHKLLITPVLSSCWGLAVQSSRTAPTRIPYGIPRHHQPEPPMPKVFGADGRPNLRVFPYGSLSEDRRLQASASRDAPGSAADLVASLWVTGRSWAGV